MYSNTNGLLPKFLTSKSSCIQNGVNLASQIVPDYTWAGQKRVKFFRLCRERYHEERREGGRIKGRWPWVSITRSTWRRAACSEDWTDKAGTAHVEHVQVFIGILDGKQTRQLSSRFDQLQSFKGDNQSNRFMSVIYTIGLRNNCHCINSQL